MASSLIPIAKVLIGSFDSFAAMEQTRDESSPPERRNPTLASDTRRFETPSMSFSLMFLQTVSMSSFMTPWGFAMSQYEMNSPFL